MPSISSQDKDSAPKRGRSIYWKWHSVQSPCHLIGSHLILANVPFRTLLHMAHTQFRLKLAKEEHYYWFMYLGSLNNGFDFRHSWIQEIEECYWDMQTLFLLLSTSLCLGSIIFSFLSVECILQKFLCILVLLVSLSSQRRDKFPLSSKKKCPTRIPIEGSWVICSSLNVGVQLEDMICFD